MRLRIFSRPGFCHLPSAAPKFLQQPASFRAGLLLALLGFAAVLPAQLSPEELRLLAQTKQMNQFFRRFNGEETLQGDRLYEGQHGYRDPALREGFLGSLFDEENSALSPADRRRFIQEACDPARPFFLDFHGSGWFAEVEARVSYLGKPALITFFMELRPDSIGYEWVFSEAYFQPFEAMFLQSDPKPLEPGFVHPLSHELDFMTLNKVFRNSQRIEAYARQDFRPDHLSLFFFECKRNNLVFKGVESVRFHFFQAPGWYFQVSEFNRPGSSRGWLIASLTPLEVGQQELLRNYILRP
jgi:hypothetical protein